ncbi:MAG: LLM class F420-dependent oxidoreductase [Polyangiaceae bacterium]|nr:LLM class F420-dependent oxidoreductase [Polyangiaceae bacterium]
MRHGVTMFATDLSMPPAELAREVEARGFDSLYLPEHTHIPTSRTTPPPTGDAELAEEYKRTLDPFVALAQAAAVTTRIELGTGVCLVAQREPIVTAKQVATLDHLCGGRVVLGVGFGWNQDEAEHHGLVFSDRRAVAREHTLAMRALWEHDVASYDGERVRLAPSWAWPKPRRRVPVLLGGGAGPRLFAHLAEWADGWMPIGGAGLAAALPDLRRAMEARGRDPSTLRLVPFGTLPDAGKLAYYRELGVTEVVFRVPSAGRDEVLPALDQWARLLR